MLVLKPERYRRTGTTKPESLISVFGSSDDKMARLYPYIESYTPITILV